VAIGAITLRLVATRFGHFRPPLRKCRTSPAIFHVRVVVLGPCFFDKALGIAGMDAGRCHQRPSAGTRYPQPSGVNRIGQCFTKNGRMKEKQVVACLYRQPNCAGVRGESRADVRLGPGEW